jgi:DNA-binding MarR family transcriptional regulator
LKRGRDHARQMDETEKQVLQFIGQRGAVITGMLMTALKLDEEATNGILHALEAKGYLEFLQDITHGDREIITARLTGEGMRVSRDDIAQGAPT